MNKNEFLNRFTNKDRLILSNIFDKINLAIKVQVPIYTNEFYTTDICMEVKKLSTLLGVKIETYGIFENSERNMMAFSYEGDNYCYFPLKLIKIENKSKFNKLSHKDYLGAIMSMGVNRNKFGDLIVIENSCYVAVSEEIASYILNNLNSIGKCTCNICELELTKSNIPKIKFEELNIIVSSLRLDCLISSICNISRNRAVELINRGNVLLNYVTEKEKDYNVSFGSTITIRGYGKFKLFCDTGVTAKNRIKILMKKFV